MNKKNNSPFQEDHTPFTQTSNHAGVKYFLKIFLVLLDPILLCLIYGVSNVSDQNKAPHLSPWLLMRTPRYLHSLVPSRAQLSSSIAQPCNNYSIVVLWWTKIQLKPMSLYNLQKLDIAGTQLALEDAFCRWEGQFNLTKYVVKHKSAKLLWRML